MCEAISAVLKCTVLQYYSVQYCSTTVYSTAVLQYTVLYSTAVPLTDDYLLHHTLEATENDE